VPEPLLIVDASVLVRYLTGDDPHLQARAKAVIDSDRPLGITAVAVLETAYVLHRVYGYSREAVVDALVEVITRSNFVGVGIDRDQIAAKLLLCRASGTVSFGDALLAATAASAEIEGVLTFDEKLDRAGVSITIP
jgi:predicted nucleic acid-binding protein